jgi:hypothetical protein
MIVARAPRQDGLALIEDRGTERGSLVEGTLAVRDDLGIEIWILPVIMAGEMAGPLIYVKPPSAYRRTLFRGA